MTTAQSLYFVVFSVYLLFFLLFSRFLVWKLYSEKKYWNRRPKLKLSYLQDTAKLLSRTIPFMSIMVPARNESLVIDNTIRHLTSLKYPAERFEVVVVTDEKEAQTAKKDRAEISWLSHGVFSGEGGGTKVPAHLEEPLKAVLLSCLSEYALCEYLSKGFQKDYPAQTPELSSIPAYERHCVVRDISIALIASKRAPSGKKLRHIIKNRCPWLSELDVDRAYPACLAVALPTIEAFCAFCDEPQRKILDRTVRHTVQANHDLTQDIIKRMTCFIAERISVSARRATRTGELQKKVNFALLDLYPTTQEVVERAMGETNGAGGPKVKHITVPVDFDGFLEGVRTGKPVASTKGRALNWGVQYLDPEAEVVGFYDAESRPHKDVLLYVGYRRMLDPVPSQVLQGPVFQVRNFYKMTPFCRIAALYQAVAHDWYLPWLFRTLPFVGGTNVFIARNLLYDVGGWDCEVLTEDLEFGTRAYLMKGAWPEYLPYPSSEQTPPTFGAFFKQRLRWGTGHLQVVQKVKGYKGIEPSAKKKLCRRLVIKGQVEWITYQAATFVPPLAMVLYYKNLLDPTLIPLAGRWLLSAFSFVYMGFTVYAFQRYKGYLDNGSAPESLPGNIAVYMALLLLPLAAFVFPVPYTSAMLLKIVGKEPKGWVKTPRTEEMRMVG